MKKSIQIKDKTLRIEWLENSEIMRSLGPNFFRQKSNDGKWTVRYYEIFMWKYVFAISLRDTEGEFAEAVNYKNK